MTKDRKPQRRVGENTKTRKISIATRVDGHMSDRVAEQRDIRKFAPQDIDGLAIPGAAAEMSAELDKKRRGRSVGFMLRKCYQRNQAIWQALCIDSQLTSTQSATLGALYDLGACSLTTLGAAAAMDPATTRGVVERLLERALILMSGDASDRRKVIVHLTRKGRKLYEAMIPVIARISEMTMWSLNPGERIALEYLLRKVADAPIEVGMRNSLGE